MHGRQMAAIAAAGNTTGISGCVTFEDVEDAELVDFERVAFGTPVPWPISGKALTVSVALSHTYCPMLNTTEMEFVEDPSEPPLGEADGATVLRFQVWICMKAARLAWGVVCSC